MLDSAAVTRREFLSVGAVAIAGGFMVSAQPLASVKALVFDTFGTVVDWRTSVSQEVEALAKRKGIAVDGAKFADAWRGGYGPSMNRVRSGELPWTVLDDLHRMILDRILVEFKITGLSAAETDSLNRAWHRLKPWPDSVSGLTRLKTLTEQLPNVNFEGLAPQFDVVEPQPFVYSVVETSATDLAEVSRAEALGLNQVYHQLTAGEGVGSGTPGERSLGDGGDKLQRPGAL